MLPSIGGSDNKGGKLEASGSFLSRMLGRSPSKGAIAPQGPAPTAGQAGKGSAAMFSSTQPPGSSLKTSINQGTASSSTNWAISSSKEGPRPPLGRAPSAKNLEEAANRPSASPRVDKLLQAANTYAPVARVPSAQRLTPLAPAGRNSGSSPVPTGSDASAVTPSGRLQSALDNPEDADLTKMSGEELRILTLSLRKETAALKDHLEAISGSGKPGSGAGMQQSASSPAAEQPARKSGVTFGMHRNSVLVVEFAKPEHQQRPSVIARTEQLNAAAAADEGMSFIEESSGKTRSGTKSSAALDNGPSMDPLQAEYAAAEAKRQLMLSKSIKKAEEDAKKAAEEKRKAEEAAALAAAAAAGPAKPIAKKRYKLLSVFPLLPPAMRREEWSLNQFAVEKRLHKGYASEVYKARDIQSGELMAVKVYNLPALGELNKVQLIREIRLHGAMAHRNIIELYVAFQEESRVILAQKYADGGDLLKALHHAGGRLTEHSAVSMVIQPLLACLVYLHSKGIIHRDIKPENILFDEGILKVADFGLALNSNEENAVTRAGTLHYMAPEVVKNPLKDHPDDFKNENRYHYNMVVDSWAVGCLAYELLVGYPPFTANTQQQVVSNINNLEVQYPKRMSEDAIDFIKSALERIPHDRATTTELIKHPWIMQHMRRGSSRHLTLQAHAPHPKAPTSDFASGIAKAKQDNDRRAADHGLPKQAIMAPF